MSPQTRSPHGTSLMPMQALGAPPPDLPPGGGYPPNQGGQPGPGPEPRGGRSKGLDYTLKGLGLLGVAVVSGFLWWLTHSQAPVTPSATPPPQHPTGKYQFTPYVTPTTVTDCSDHATGEVSSFLQSHQCTGLTRSLYTTKLDNGDQVLTSVSVVKLGSAAAARQLDAISRGNSTGHIKDEVEEGYQVPNGPANLENGGYASSPVGKTDIIVVTEFMSKAEDTSGNLGNQIVLDQLRGVSKDALNQQLGQ